MKNRQFRFLSLEEKQRILTFVLRDKTNNELTIQEEKQLISTLSSKTQFHIRVFTHKDEFCEAISFAKGVIVKVMFGAAELEKMKVSGVIPCNAIAVMSEATETPESRNQVYIFIPPCRKSIKEEYIQNGKNSLCFNLKGFSEASNR